MTCIKSQINWFTAIRSTEKMFPSYLEVEKNWFLAISSLTNSVVAIWRENKVDSCFLETTKCGSQQLGARKKIMTCI